MSFLDVKKRTDEVWKHFNAVRKLSLT